MDVCVLAEDPKLDQRVPLSPGASRGLVRAGNRVFIQQGAGDPTRPDFREQLLKIAREHYQLRQLDT